MLTLDHYCQTCSESSRINPISSPRDIGADAHSSVSRGSGRDLNHWLRIWMLHWWHVLFSCDSWSLNIVVQSSYHLLFILRLPSWYCFRFALSLSFALSRLLFGVLPLRSLIRTFTSYTFFCTIALLLISARVIRVMTVFLFLDHNHP